MLSPITITIPIAFVIVMIFAGTALAALIINILKDDDPNKRAEGDII